MPPQKRTKSPVNPAVTFTPGDYAIFPDKGLFVVGEEEETDAAGFKLVTVKLTGDNGRDVIRIAKGKLAATLRPLPSVAELKAAEDILAGPSKSRLYNQGSGATQCYAATTSWDITRMAESVTTLRPSIEVWPHTSINAAQAIRETIGRFARLSHLITGEDEKAASTRLTDLARVRPAQPPEKRYGMPSRPKAVPAVAAEAAPPTAQPEG